MTCPLSALIQLTTDRKMSRKKSTKETSASPYPISSRTTCRTSPLQTEEIEDNVSDQTSEDGFSLDNLDNNSSLTIGLMKHFIEKMEKNITSNINATIDRKVGGVKDEISEMKVQMERSNGFYEEMQNRISTVEDQVHDLNNLGDEMENMRTIWNEAISEANLEACRARKNNIIFHGVTGGSKDTDVARKNFDRICRENLKMSQEWIDKVDIDEIYHFTPKKDEDPWPLFVKFGKAKHREDLFKASPNLKGSNIVMRNDLAPWLIRKRNILKTESDKLKLQPHNYRTRLRDSPFDVWVQILKPHAKKWVTWDGRKP